jgi:hypothetical protein
MLLYQAYCLYAHAASSLLMMRRIFSQGHGMQRAAGEGVTAAAAALSLGTPGWSPPPEATMVRGAPRDNRAKTANYMGLG